MNLGDIKLAVKRVFGDEAGVQINDADITRWANQGQNDICRKVDVLTTILILPSVVGIDKYSFGVTDFLRISRVLYNYHEIPFIPWAQLNRLYPDRSALPITNGTPSVYSLNNRQLVFDVAPDTVYDISISYIARPADLVVDGDIPNIPVEMHEDIVSYCLVRAYELDSNEAAIGRMGTDYTQRINQSRGDTDHPFSEFYPSVQDTNI